ncbi:hypothetical protein [uncultured Pontibacter sp.]|uniref:hypothetical protein n=1 Tax=uncultured Pontibacter sp. TaxID=453356 RepID=UPI002624F4F5|nr:hypothetical protein [uncultured Pontibacter sp.]
MERKLWYLLVKGNVGQEVSALADFYSYGEHLGIAIHKANDCARVIGLTDCQAVEASLLPMAGVTELSMPTERLSADVFVGRGLHTFPESAGEKIFICPTGIVKGATNGILDLESAQQSFRADGPDAAGTYTFRLVLGVGMLEHVFFCLSAQLRGVDRGHLSLKTGSACGSEKEEWITDGPTLLSFIQRNLPDTLENGFVTLALSASGGETSLCMDKFKRLILKTCDKRLFASLLQSMEMLGIPSYAGPLRNRQGYLTYRPFNSLDSAGLKQKLLQNGFIQVEAKRRAFNGLSRLFWRL